MAESLKPRVCDEKHLRHLYCGKIPLNGPKTMTASNNESDNEMCGKSDKKGNTVHDSDSSLNCDSKSSGETQNNQIKTLTLSENRPSCCEMHRTKGLVTSGSHRHVCLPHSGSEANTIIFHSSPHRTSRACWLCIPADNLQFENQHFDDQLGNSLEMDKIKSKLFCRPAEGLGQNCFRLKIKNEIFSASPGDSVGNGRRHHINMHRYNSKSESKLERKTSTHVKSERVVSGKARYRRRPHPYSSYMPSLTEIECNNSNDTNANPRPSRSKPSQGIPGTTIRVQGDGRCLFRSLITCLSPDLQKTRRDDFGSPLRRQDEDYETHMADILRAKVVKLMQDNAHFYGQLERTVINADRSIPAGYSHFRERLMDMILTSTMPGDLELNATSMALERQVLVLDANLRPIVVYGKDRYPESEVVVVRYTRLGPDVGHYDAVIPDHSAFNVLDLGTKHGDHNVMKDETVTVVKPDVMNSFADLVSKSKNIPNKSRDIPSGDTDHKCTQVPSQRDLSGCSEADTVYSSKMVGRNVNNSLNNREINKSQNSTNTALTPGSEESDEESCYEQSCNNMRFDTSDNALYVMMDHDNEDELFNEKSRFYVTNKNDHKKHTNKASTSGSVKWETSKTKRCQLNKNANAKVNETNHGSANGVKSQGTQTKESRETAHDKEARDDQSKDGENKKREAEQASQDEPAAKKSKTSRKARKMQIVVYALPNKRKKMVKARKNHQKKEEDKVNTNSSHKADDPCDAGPDERTEPISTNPQQSHDVNKDRSESDIKKSTPPPSNNPYFLYDGRTCLVCEKPTPAARHCTMLCTLCGRVAHRHCVASRRVGDAGNYFQCWFCVQD